MRAPSTPRMTVTTALMFCLPGRTRRASMPMTAPKMMVPMISTTMTASFCATVVALLCRPFTRLRDLLDHGSGKSAFRNGRSATCLVGQPRQSESAEADPASLTLAEGDVAEDVSGDDDLPPLVVGQGQQAVLLDRLGHRLGDILRAGFCLECDLARDVLDADLDLHVSGLSSMRWARGIPPVPGLALRLTSRGLRTFPAHLGEVAEPPPGAGADEAGGLVLGDRGALRQ